MKRLLALLALLAFPAAALAQPAPSITVMDVAVAQDASSARVSIKRHGRLNGRPSSVSFSTTPGSASPGSDYQAVTGTVSFTASQTMAYATVPLLPAIAGEALEYFTVSVRPLTNARLYDGSGRVTIPASLAPATQTCHDGTVIPATSVCPPHIPPTDPTPEPSPTLAGLAPIADNFDTLRLLMPAWGDGQIPGTAAPDVVGAFRFNCTAGQVAAIDPIVNFGGRASHLHQFFGNVNVQPDSTYASLRANGASTCEPNNPATVSSLGIALNRSAYWMPAMLNGKGQVVLPDYVSIYYKRRPKSDPMVGANTSYPGHQGIAVDLPNGLKFVFGRDPTNPAGGQNGAYFNCDGPTATSGHFDNLEIAQANCPSTPTLVKQWDGSMLPTYNRIGMVISAPDCWDGKNLDSPNHRSHTSFGSYGYWGYYKCPPTHPYAIPGFLMGAWYTVAPDETYSLSSDSVMTPGLPRGSSAHADFFGAWSPVALKLWHDNCIDKLLSCSGFVLGNGKQALGAFGGPWNANPRLVPIPPQ